MKYQICGDTTFLKTTVYCKFDQYCADHYRSASSLYRKTTDSRDGTVCSDRRSSCYC